MDRDLLVKAAADAVAARLAIGAAARRRAAATVSAQNLIDLATATERAERDAAWSALAASVQILLAEQVPVADIAELCGVSATTVLGLSGGAASGAPGLCSAHLPDSSPKPHRHCARPESRRRPIRTRHG